MSRLESVKGRTLNKIPRLGTKLRKVYDEFQRNKGRPVPSALLFDNTSRRVIADLTDYYGLDIRCHSMGFYWLVGEWHGENYHDYLANTVKEMKDL